MRMIVAFEKTEQVRHVGHLDLQRAVNRALRRSGLPIRYSNGFNTHALLSFASPQPLGVSGEEELLRRMRFLRRFRPLCRRRCR